MKRTAKRAGGLPKCGAGAQQVKATLTFEEKGPLLCAEQKYHLVIKRGGATNAPNLKHDDTSRRLAAAERALYQRLCSGKPALRGLNEEK